MNPVSLAAIVLLFPAAVLLTRKISRCYPWHLCTSAADWLILPVVGVYILIILTAGWLARGAEWWNSRATPEAASHRSWPGGFPPRVTT